MIVTDMSPETEAEKEVRTWIVALELKCVCDVNSHPAVVPLCSSSEDEGCLTFISKGLVLGWEDLSMRLQSWNVRLPTQLLGGRAQLFLAAERHCLLS